MSNQTFVKKDRISFAQDLNENIVIAPSNITTNALFIGPNSAVSYDPNSNITNIQYLQGVTLSNQYIYADGTYLSNLPTSGGITQSNLNSTITGLGTIGYVSSSQLISTVTGLGGAGNPATWANYPAINTVNVAGNIISNADTLLVNTISSATSGYVDITSFINLQQNSIFGVNNLQTDSISANNYGNIRFDNSVNMNANTISNINTAYFGYTITSYQDGLYMQEYTAPDASVTSPALGLSYNAIPFVGTSADTTCINLYNVNKIFYCDGSSQTTSATNIIQSSIIGLGTFGYVSTSQLTSTVAGIGGGASQAAITSSIIGLGTFGYVSSSQLQSTVRGLGNIYLSSITPFNQLSTISTIQSSITSSLVGLGNLGYISSSQLQSTVIGLGNLGYISSSQLQSTVIGLVDHAELQSTSIGLGSLGYISSTQLQSTVRGLGNIYLSTFNGSTNFLSVSQGFISSLNVNSLVFGTGQGWIDFGAVRTLILSSLQINTGELLASSITGDGSQIFNLPAISSLSLQSTVRGLGNIYVSSFNSISSLNISSGNIVTSTFQAGYVSTNQLIGTVITQSLNPFSAGAQLGFGSNTSQNGFYAEGHFRSTFTQVIQPTLDNNTYSNIVQINGNISSQNIIVSSLTGLNIVTSNFSSFFYGGIEKYNYISTSQLTSTVIGLGNIYVSSATTGLINYLSTISTVQSTITSSLIGLGSLGYISSTQLISSVTGLLNTTSPINYLSTISTVQSSITSSLIGLGSLGYISSTQLISSVTGLLNTTAPINYLSTISTVQSSITSSIIGLGTFGYISSSQLQSTVTGLGASVLPSTIVGLGSFGYISSTQLQSTVRGLTINPLSTISTTQSSITSSLIGLGTLGYISSTQLISSVTGLGNIYLSTNSVPSTIVGLGTFGYISSTQLQSTVTGLGASVLPSTITGLGTFGYISSSQLISSVTGLLNTTAPINYLSTLSTVQSSITSSITGLGTLGYISSTQLQSTVRGLGTYGYISSLQNISSFNISTGSLNASTMYFIDVNTNARQLLLVSSGVLTLNGQGISGSGGSGSGLTVSPYVCGGYLATNQSIPASADTDVTFSDDFDPQNWYNTSTYRFQPSIAGYYEVSFQVWWAAGTVATNQYNIQILKNGNQVVISQLQITSSVGLTNNATKIIYMNGSTDYLRFTVYNGNPGAVNIQGAASGAGTFFSAALLTNGSSGEPLTSSVVGLGSIGYISSTQLFSTVTGLGSLGYISSSQLISSVTGLGNIYLSTNSVPSTIVGLGTFGYISSSQLQSTVRGLTINPLSTISTTQSTITSSIVGLGTLGYISSSQLISSVTGLLNTTAPINYLSTLSTVQSSITSSLVGLGTFGYISSLSLQSTIRGLGTFSYISSLNISSGNLFSGNISSLRINASSINTNTTITNNIVSLTSTITFQDSLVPSLDNTYDLGASTNTWRHLYVGGGSIYLKNSVDVNAAISYTPNNIININKPLNIDYSINTNIEPKIRFTTSTNTNILEIKAEPSGFDNLSYDVFKVTGFIDLSGNAIYNALFYFTNNPTTLSNYAYTVTSNISVVNNIDYPTYVSYDSLYNATSAKAIAADWSVFSATNGIDMNNNDILNLHRIYGYPGYPVEFNSPIDMLANEISNMAQTANPYSAATNIIARRVYFDSPADILVGTSPYRNILTTSPATPITLLYPTAFYTYLNCTVSFRCDNTKDDLAYFLTLSNITATSDLSGQIFNDLYPFIENQNAILTSNHSITFQEHFNITTWANGDNIVPMLFVISGTGSHTLSNMKFSMVYEPLLP